MGVVAWCVLRSASEGNLFSPSRISVLNSNPASEEESFTGPMKRVLVVIRRTSGVLLCSDFRGRLLIGAKQKSSRMAVAKLWMQGCLHL